MGKNENHCIKSGNDLNFSVYPAQPKPTESKPDFSTKLLIETNKRLSAENTELKRILRLALHDLKIIFEAYQPCDFCAEDAHKCDFDSACKWKHYDEAMKLIGVDENADKN